MDDTEIELSSLRLACYIGGPDFIRRAWRASKKKGQQGRVSIIEHVAQVRGIDLDVKHIEKHE